MLVIIEGLDRTGKSTISDHFKSQGFEYIHMSAPNKKYVSRDYTGPSYLDEMIELLLSLSCRNIVLDRSHYGERIWPYVYGRQSLLTEDDIEVLREIEATLEVRRILMVDPDIEAHWKRCVDNKEPMDRRQFDMARTLYSEFPDKYGFEVWTLPQFLESLTQKGQPVKVPEPPTFSLETPKAISFELPKEEVMTPEQKRLAYANAVNDLLSKPLIKQKKWPYNELEDELKVFLNGKLGDLLGQANTNLSPEDIKIVKEFVTIFKNKNKK